MQFIDSARFMASALSNALNNISEGMHKIKCKFRGDDKKSETCSIKYKYCNCFLEYTSFKYGLKEYKCLCYNRNYQDNYQQKCIHFRMHTNFLAIITISLSLNQKFLNKSIYFWLAFESYCFHGHT